MKIGVVGCGALGSYYGACLCRARHEVHFLLRSDYDVVRESGLTVRTLAGDFRVRPEAARDPRQIGECELVVIGLKTTANHRFADLLPPLVGPPTSVITLQNGLGNEAQLAAVIGSERVLGGLCFVCLNRPTPGLIVHSAHGRIVLGEYRRPPSDRTNALAQLFRDAGVPCDVTPDLERAHWEKLVWNVPFNGLGVAGAAGYEAVIAGTRDPRQPLGPVLATDALLADPRWEALVRELMMEVIRTARALGHDLSPQTAVEQIERTREMQAYKASTLVDFERGLPLELVSLFLAPGEEARRAGVPTPRLNALGRLLSELDPAGQRAESHQLPVLASTSARSALP
jgi:2-dehydropantoate 2-reductase